MNKTIKMPKRASGSKPDQIGDGTLFYTSDVSDFNQSLSGWFVDNLPKLSRKHASLVWRYNRDVDRYILIHVQGSQVESEALGRCYPFRAGYEISRSDMNELSFDLTSLFKALPRIATMKYGRIELETNVKTVSSAIPRDVTSLLTDNIMAAIVSGKRLFVEVQPLGESWREDGIFSSLELSYVLAAIDAMPVKLRRYATFAFCVDELFEKVLDNVRVIFYRRGCSIAVEKDDLRMDWNQAIHTQINLSDNESQRIKIFPFPGEKELLMTDEELQQAYDVFDKAPTALSDNEWDIWLKLGHSLDEIKPSGWKEFGDYINMMPDAIQMKYAALIHDMTMKWNLEGMTRKCYEKANGAQSYSTKDKHTLQRKALKEYLKEERYGFLFSDGVPQNMLTSDFVLQLNDDEDMQWWYEQFKKLGALKNSGVESAFGKRLEPIASRLKTLKDIIKFMLEYPFVQVKAYTKPDTVKNPTEKERKKLTDQQTQLIDDWLKSEAKKLKFKKVTDVIDAMTKALDDDDSVQVMSLHYLSDDQLLELLNGNNVTLDQIDTIIKESERLNKKDGWEDYKMKVDSAVSKYLFNTPSSCYNKEKLSDVKIWADICEINNRVGDMIRSRFSEMLQHMSADEISSLANNVKAYYAPQEGQPGQPSDYMFKLFIDVYSEKEPEKAKELNEMVNPPRQFNLMSVCLLALAGLLLGTLIGGLGYRLYAKSSEPLPATNKAIAFFVPENENRMLMLAGIPDSINEVTIDSMSIYMDSVRKNLSFLKEWNEKSLLVPEQLDSAQIWVSPVNEIEAFVDSMPLVINHHNSLFAQLLKRECKVDSIIVLSKPKTSIVIPNDSLKEQPWNSPSYYFKLITYIERKLPTDKAVNLPY